MNEAVKYKEIASRYGLAATPECVTRLTQIVAQADLDLDKVAKIISGDPQLKARLLRVANPRADDPADYTIDTVEGALMRNGVGCALLIAMGSPLGLALAKTFQTMLSMKLESVERRLLPPFEGEHLLARIGFSGKAEGQVYMRLSLEAGRRLASAILGIPADEIGDGPEINDTIGELLNIMTGNFKSNLCDAGLECRLSTPDVGRTEDATTPTVPGGGLERMSFRSGPIYLAVDLTVNPWVRD